MISKFFTLIAILFCCSLAASAQSPTSKHYYNLIRSADDFSFLRHDSLKKDFFDPIKFISLSPKKKSYLSLGGELRHQYQWYQHVKWANSSDKNGHLLQRYMFHTDFHAGRHFRIFVQANSGLIHGRSPGPRPVIDKNEFELNQYFLEFKPFSPTGKHRLSKLELGIRIGRMEEKFGTARLIAPREGQNIRRSFVGLHAFLRKGKWKVDAFALNEILSKPGIFDDVRDQDEWLIGAVAHRSAGKGLHFEPYFLWTQDRSSIVFGDTARQWRMSPGFRFFQKGKHPLRWNLESSAQWGQFSDQNIFAWLLAADLGYQFRKPKVKPFVGIGFSYGSGDRNAKPGDLSTWEAFFPKPILGQSVPLNPSNLLQLHSEFRFQIGKKSKISLSHDHLFRPSPAEVIYNPGSKPVLPLRPNLNASRYLGHQSRIAFKQQFGLHYYLLLEYSIFPPGNFQRNMGRDKVLHYASAKSVFRF